jgi:hypothetical protein
LFFTVTFLPVLTFVFGLKNDILTGYLPVRFFISESIADGYFPWWNPYVNFGLPQHADMSGGFWNPVTWIICLTAGYNVYTITIEVLLYIIIGGAGIYKLASLWNWDKHVKTTAAISYICCGYFVGDIQHLNWVAGAGFLPCCFLSYSLLLQNFSYKRLVGSIIVFYFFISSSHPGLIIGAVYLFALYTLFDFTGRRHELTGAILFKKIGSIIIFILLLLIVSAGMIMSYAEILPFITRETKPFIENTSHNATTFQSLASLLLPFTVVKGDDFFQSDIALRNCYTGLVPLLFFISGIVKGFRKRETSFFLLTGLFFLFISTDSFFQYFAYKYFPFLGYVRLPAEFRIFALFCLIVSGCNHLHSFAQKQERNSTELIISRLFIFFIIAAILWSCSEITRTGKSIFLNFPSIDTNQSFLQFFKNCANGLTVYDTVIVQGLVQIFLLVWIGQGLKKYALKTLLLVACLDMTAATTLNLPFTGYGTRSAADVQALLNQSPRGIPVPQLHAIEQNNKGPAGADSIIGAWSFYNKQPGVTRQTSYPVVFKNTQNVFKQPVLQKISVSPFLFFEPDQTDSITLQGSKSMVSILTFSPNRITASLNANTKGSFILLYQSYPYWHCYVNKAEVEKKTVFGNFIAASITKPGNYLIEYNYYPGRIITASIIGFTLVLILLLILILQLARKKLRNY